MKLLFSRIRFQRLSKFSILRMLIELVWVDLIVTSSIIWDGVKLCAAPNNIKTHK